MRPGVTSGLVALLASSALAQNLPQGFSEEILVTGLEVPVGLAFTSDDRIFVTEKISGRIVACDLDGNSQVVGVVPDVASLGEGGLLGIVVDPAWPERPYVYVHFTSNDGMVHLTRYTIEGESVEVPEDLELNLGDRYEILNSVPNFSSGHNGGSVRFGPDGMLYASFGDDTDKCAAQSYTDGRGTIVRLDVSGLPDGSGGPPAVASIAPADNPFPATAGLGPLVWAYGLRNPFRFNIDPATSNIYIADVGQDAWEEVDEVTVAGQNFGWPVFEGTMFLANCAGANPPYVTPIAEVSHLDAFLAVISFGGRYRNQPGGEFNFGASYEGDVFYHDYVLGAMRRVKWNGNAWVTPPPVLGQADPLIWATGFEDVVDAIPGPGGAIYYTHLIDGAICRLKSETANQDLLTVEDGNLQVGVAGRSLAQPLVARLATANGTPIAGVPVTFSFLEGGGTFGPQPVVSDAAGYATTTLELSMADGTDPVVQVEAPGAVPALFRSTWRGLGIDYFAESETLLVNVRMATASAPLALTFDVPVGTPYSVTPYGEIWTSVLVPKSTLTVVSGLFTDQQGVFSSTVPMIPSTLEVDLTAQAFGLDPGLIPESAQIFVSNPAPLTVSENLIVPQLGVESPQNTFGTAGRAAIRPMTVRVENAAGSPLAGAPVMFSVTSGGGTLDPPFATTDADGVATSFLTLSETDPTDPEVSVTSLGSAPATFDFVWRGMLIDPSPGSGAFDVEIRMGAPGVPVYFSWDPVQAEKPYVVTPWGSVWTSMLEAQPTGGTVIGFTDASGIWTASLSGLPRGVPFTLQGFGVDASLPQDLGFFMIGKPLVITF